MSRGEVLTRLTVWIALAGYAFGAAGFVLARNGNRLLSPARWAWTIGVLALVAHIACAYHYYHAWSQTSAYLETARQTAEVTGLDWGGGVFINYLFVIVWAADAVWWWRGHAAYRRRPRFIGIALHSFLIFIIFNATVVFKTGAVRWAGLALCVGMLAIWARAASEGPGKDEPSAIER